MRLTPPTLPVFLIAILLGGLSIASRFTKIPMVGSFVASHHYWMLAAGFGVLVAGVVLKGL